MTKLLWPAVVRIIQKKETNIRPVGLGFLVADQHVFTCSHVVTSAIGCSLEDRNINEELYVDFPLLSNENRMMKAKIVFEDIDDDIVLLKLLGTRSNESYSISVTDSDDLVGNDFWCYGIPDCDGNGHWITGVIMGPTGSGHFQFESRSGYGPELGFSGGPVWDNSLFAVVGMVVSLDAGNPSAKAGRMIPAQRLIEILNEHRIPHVIVPQLIKNVTTELFKEGININTSPSKLIWIITQFANLNEPLNEWKELHNLVQDCLTTLVVFRDFLTCNLGYQERVSKNQLRLFWANCKPPLERLDDFARTIKYIDRPFEQTRNSLKGPRWIIMITQIRQGMNACLVNGDFDEIYGNTLDLWNECYTALYLADKELRKMVGEIHEISNIITRSIEYENIR